MNLEPVAGRLYRHLPLLEDETYVTDSGRECVAGEIVMVTKQKHREDNDDVSWLNAQGVEEQSSCTRLYSYGWGSWWEEVQ